jgi:glycerol kinase
MPANRCASCAWIAGRCQRSVDAVSIRHSGQTDRTPGGWTTALGAAYLAGLATGFWKSVADVESFWRAERRFEPHMHAEKRERYFGEWKTAVARALR